MTIEKGDLYRWNTKASNDYFIILGLEEDYPHGMENPTIRVNYLNLRFNRKSWDRVTYITKNAKKLG